MRRRLSPNQKPQLEKIQSRVVVEPLFIILLMLLPSDMVYLCDAARDDDDGKTENCLHIMYPTEKKCMCTREQRENFIKVVVSSRQNKCMPIYPN